MKTICIALDFLMLGSAATLALTGYEFASRLFVFLLGVHVVLMVVAWAMIAFCALGLAVMSVIGIHCKEWESLSLPPPNKPYRVGFLVAVCAVSVLLAVAWSPGLALVMLVNEAASFLATPAVRALITWARKVGAKG